MRKLFAMGCVCFLVMGLGSITGCPKATPKVTKTGNETTTVKTSGSGDKVPEDPKTIELTFEPVELKADDKAETVVKFKVVRGKGVKDEGVAVTFTMPKDKSVKIDAKDNTFNVPAKEEKGEFKVIIDDKAKFIEATAKDATVTIAWEAVAGKDLAKAKGNLEVKKGK